VERPERPRPACTLDDRAGTAAAITPVFRDLGGLDVEVLSLPFHPPYEETAQALLTLFVVPVFIQSVKDPVV
jgi:hypothetical protein